MRNGITNEGRRLWNPDAPKTEKFEKALKYALLEVAPLSAKQFERLYYAATDQPNLRGEKYELSDQLAGFYGLGPVKVDPIKSLNYKITNFRNGIRGTSNLFAADVQKGGPIEPNTIIERYIVANAQRYEKYNELQRKIKAAQNLNATEDSIYDLFERRGENKNLDYIKDNQFRPINLTKPMKEGFERIEQELRSNFDDATIPAGLPEYVEDILYNLKEIMENIPLGDNFYKYIKPEDWIIREQGELPGASGERQVTQVPPLPPQPMPNQQVISPPPVQVSQLNQGLTPTESSYLSEDEKQMRLRQRGLS